MNSHTPRIYVCADLHFGHNNIIAYENRPFSSVEEMNEKLIENWNQTVSQKDIVFVLGDVGFGSKEKLKSWVSQLNGRKSLIMGNHDRDKPIRFWQDAGFEFVSPFPIIYSYMGRKIEMMHEPPILLNPARYILHGHVHGDPDYDFRGASTSCVCVERTDYRPILLEDAIR